MTIKEIAELCEVSDETIRRWIHKIADDPTQNVEGYPGNFFQGLLEKLTEAEKSGKEAADFTLEETIAIIGEGGENKTLASLLAENAANRTALTVQGGNNQAAQLAGLASLMGRIEKTLDDPQKALYEELENFVQKNLEVDTKRIYKVPVWHLYDAYSKNVKTPLDEHQFMHKIALDHPEFELVYKRREWAFVRCCTKRIL